MKGREIATSNLLQQLQCWRAAAIARAQTEAIASVEVDRLLEYVAGWTARDRLLGRVPAEQLDWQALNTAWQRRWRERVPLHYVIGTIAWRDLELKVSPAVLIPRPETELLIDLAAPEVLAAAAESIWLDLGTGSGAIAIAVARLRPDIQVRAIDLSPDALQIARTNVQRYGLEHCVQCWQGSWFEPLTLLRGRVRGLLANPPYIPHAEIDRLQPEVCWHEPHLALDGGPSGMEAIAHLIQTAPEYVISGGFWAIELMQGQAGTVAQMLHRDGRYGAIAIHPDFSGVDRFVSARIV